MKKYLLALTLIICWSLPGYCLLYNQFYPSYESALGVAYGFAFGSAIHLFVLLLWVLIRRTKMHKSELIILLSSLVVMLVLTAISNSSALSKFSP